MRTQLHLPPWGGGGREEAPPGAASHRRKGLRDLPCPSRISCRGRGLAKMIFAARLASCTAERCLPRWLHPQAGIVASLSRGATFAISDLI